MIYSYFVFVLTPTGLIIDVFSVSSLMQDTPLSLVLPGPH